LILSKDFYLEEVSSLPKSEKHYSRRSRPKESRKDTYLKTSYLVVCALIAIYWMLTGCQKHYISDQDRHIPYSERVENQMNATDN
jgi:hypothetical protein